MAQAEWKVPPTASSGTAPAPEKTIVKPARYAYSRVNNAVNPMLNSPDKAASVQKEQAADNQTTQQEQNETPGQNGSQSDQTPTVRKPVSSDRGGSLGFLFEDSERTLLILLIILLSEEGADAGLIMALMYCVM